MPAEILVPLTLVAGLAALATAPWGIQAGRSRSGRLVVLALYAAILAVGYLMGREGIIADERKLACCSTIAPLYGSGWYLLLTLSAAAIIVQVRFIQLRRAKRWAR